MPSAYAIVANRARVRVKSAIKSGALVRQACVDCGNPEVQAHHPNGYGQGHELDVEWVCTVHHLARHGKTARAARPSWRRKPGIRAYMAETRPRDPYARSWAFGELSSPVRLLRVIRMAWELLRTDEERAHARALFAELSVPEEKT